MLKIIVALLFTFLLPQTNAGYTIKNGQNETIIPQNKEKIKEANDCGITPRVYFSDSEILTISHNKEFFVSASTQNKDVHISGYGESIKQGNKHVAKIFLEKECISAQNLNIIEYDVYFYFQEKQSKIHNVITMKAESLCQNEENFKSIRDAIYLAYNLMWVITFSFLPVFPIVHSIIPVIIIVFYFLLWFIQDINPFITLAIMVLVFRFSPKSQQIARQYTYDVSKQAFLSERSFITNFLFIGLLSFIVTLMWFFRSSEVTQVGVFEKISILILNCNILLVHANFFCRIVWLNQFRHLFWWCITLIIIFTFFKSQIYSFNEHFFSLLTPGYFSQSCQFTNLCFIILVNPICLYIRRGNKHYQFISTFILLFCQLIENLQLKLWTCMFLVALWIFFESIRRGFMELVRFRWLSIPYEE